MKTNCKFVTYFVYANKWCPRRSLEASRLCRYFDVNNLISVIGPKKANLIVIFTCGVFAAEEEFSILTIEKSLREKSAKIVTTGCLQRIDPERLKRYDNALLISPGNLETLDSLIEAKVPFVKVPYVTTTDEFHDLYHGRLASRIKRYAVSKVKSSNSRNSPSTFTLFIEFINKLCTFVKRDASLRSSKINLIDFIKVTNIATGSSANLLTMFKLNIVAF